MRFRRLNESVSDNVDFDELLDVFDDVRDLMYEVEEDNQVEIELATEDGEAGFRIKSYDNETLLSDIPQDEFYYMIYHLVKESTSDDEFMRKYDSYLKSLFRDKDKLNKKYNF